MPDPMEFQAPTALHNDLLKRWIAAISDQVRNPVASILAALQLFDQKLKLCTHQGGCGAKEMLDTSKLLMERVRRLERYCDEISAFSEPPRLNRRTFNLSSLIYETISEVRLETVADVTIAFLPSTGDGSCRADPWLIKAALRACVNNGIEAVPAERTPSLRLEWHCGADDAWIAIDDNGPGFPTDQVNQALEPFFSTKEAGTGIGLSLAQRNLAAHDGGVSIEKSPHLSGARLKLWFPYVERQHETVNPSATPEDL